MKLPNAAGSDFILAGLAYMDAEWVVDIAISESANDSANDSSGNGEGHTGQFALTVENSKAAFPTEAFATMQAAFDKVATLTGQKKAAHIFESFHEVRYQRRQATPSALLASDETADGLA